MEVVVKILVVSAVITLFLALGLIASQWPKTLSATNGGLDFSNQRSGVDVGQTPVTMRDGFDLQIRDYPDAYGPLLILVHGSGWHGHQFLSLAAGLQDVAHVVVPDLRGHGPNPGRRGDIDYIGQLEDDLADLIKATAKPGQKVVLLGHSSGGGLVTRTAGGSHGMLLDGAILLAPFLKHDAPTTRPGSGGWANVLLRRIIGLNMLNAAKITALNHLQVIQFRFPASVLDGPLGDTATTGYSFRLNTSYAPRGDYLGDVAALPEFLLIVGEKDEAFIAAKYQPLMSGVTDKGQYLLVPDTGHLAIVDAPTTLTAIRTFLNEI
ncbi:MAG: pimeloyl-ACP methyl ester carboxylesterase [Paracoccaceae bacterium]|jgi:pimeloyl-ACP methyl ester carboxylesterase